MSEAKQLAALARLHRLFDHAAIDYWVFGGWAVDFHAGSVTREHDDLDIAVWLVDYKRIATLLDGDGWSHAPAPDEDGYTTYANGTVSLELAFLARDQGGRVYTPLRDGRAAWPDGTFEHDLGALNGVRVRLVSLRGLKADKSETRDDAGVAAKDRADMATLSRLS